MTTRKNRRSSQKKGGKSAISRLLSKGPTNTSASVTSAAGAGEYGRDGTFTPKQQPNWCNLPFLPNEENCRQCPHAFSCKGYSSHSGGKSRKLKRNKKMRKNKLRKRTNKN